MMTSRSSVTGFSGTIRRCSVGLCRLAALLFVLQIAIFAAVGATPGVTDAVAVSGASSSSAHLATTSDRYEGGMVGSASEFNRGMFILADGVESISHLALLVLVPLLGILILLSLMAPTPESRHLLLALLTVIGLLPLVLCDLSSTPWAAGALPHLSNTLLLGGVVPLVATISMMSVAILLARRGSPIRNDATASSPAARRTAIRSAGDRAGREVS